ncbi:hypothetical protein FUSO6_09835 [Fusobacterium necrophorum DAB]|nr:hypothetical protein FUSO6_09835 [Fusobacterium necrophorum DAB]
MNDMCQRGKIIISFMNILIRQKHIELFVQIVKKIFVSLIITL